MEIIVNRGVVVTADTIEEALEKTKPVEGVTVSVSANPRPQQPQQTIQRSVVSGRTSPPVVIPST